MWVPEQYFDDIVKNTCLTILIKPIPSNWTLQYSLYHAFDCGDHITANTYVIFLLQNVYSDISPSIRSNGDFPIYGFHTQLTYPAPTDCVIENLSITPQTITKIAPQKISNIVTIVHFSLHNDVATMSSSNSMLNPYYPAMEPSPVEHHNTLFGRKFGILIDTVTSYGARCISNW